MTKHQGDLEHRIAALEAQATGRREQARGTRQAGERGPIGAGDAAMMQAFLQGAYAATALADLAQLPAQEVGGEGGAMGFAGRLGRPKVSRYDSVFFCRTRFNVCGPEHCWRQS